MLPVSQILINNIYMRSKNSVPQCCTLAAPQSRLLSLYTHNWSCKFRLNRGKACRRGGGKWWDYVAQWLNVEGIVHFGRVCLFKWQLYFNCFHLCSQKPWMYFMSYSLWRDERMSIFRPKKYFVLEQLSFSITFLISGTAAVTHQSSF